MSGFILWAVVVKGVYPAQCVVVWVNKNSAVKLSKHLNKYVAPETEVQQVDSFFPSGMTNADSAWTTATEKYLQGCHLNTSGESE